MSWFLSLNCYLLLYSKIPQLNVALIKSHFSWLWSWNLAAFSWPILLLVWPMVPCVAAVSWELAGAGLSWDVGMSWSLSLQVVSGILPPPCGLFLWLLSVWLLHVVCSMAARLMWWVRAPKNAEAAMSLWKFRPRAVKASLSPHSVVWNKPQA